MEQYLYLIPTLPLAGFLLLSLMGRRLSKNAVAGIGAGSIVVSAVLTILLGFQFMLLAPADRKFEQILWNWFSTEDLSVSIGLSVDVLTLVFLFIITFVGALIHIYSIAFMREDRDYARFFASMNLFVCSMLILVMADNLVLMYLGWEGVGLCSYLLIGFWYEKDENCRAANKAFLITRIGDTAMLIGLFLLFYEFKTLNTAEILSQAPQHFAEGSPRITLIALLLLGGAVGKSAQLPLQTWLPDAMAGPSPVSALIHAATMVTAGVYLIARTHTIFILSPEAMLAVAFIGAVTLFIAGCSALVQTDIKRILAYSTISQIGYMFLALGVGAWSAAIFHFFTHAFFKALLFLSAGAIIESLHHEHNIFRMGGLRSRMPVVFYTFVAGAASLVALPLVTAGFYSKEQILWYAFSAEKGNITLWIFGMAGALITALYTTRLVFVVFFGQNKTPVSHLPGRIMTMPLIILAIFSIVAGFIEWPHNLLHITVFSDFLHQSLPVTVEKAGTLSPFLLQGFAVFITLFGIYLGYVYYLKKPHLPDQALQSPVWAGVRKFLLEGWQFDKLYDNVFVRPFVYLALVNRGDIFDSIYNGIARASLSAHRLLSVSQNGSLRWYIAGVLVGILLIITLQIVE